MAGSFVTCGLQRSRKPQHGETGAGCRDAARDYSGTPRNSFALRYRRVNGFAKAPFVVRYLTTNVWQLFKPALPMHRAHYNSIVPSMQVTDCPPISTSPLVASTRT